MRLILLLLSFSLIHSAVAQDTPANFDEELASKLGVDDYGMKNYIFVLLKTGDTEIADKDSLNALFRGHFENMEAMAESGKLALSGPFGKNDRVYRGLFILNAESNEEAMQLLNNDQAIAAGVFDVELTPWYGSAALPVFQKTHDKIARKKP
ncbi:MAG: YciI family protein [Cryomorphaceae bacterium]|nr:YciI family protein [Flavobacteriales bacterium]